MDNKQIIDFQLLRDRLSASRADYIAKMDEKISIFETTMQKKGFHLYWANNEHNLVQLMLKLMPRERYCPVCFDLPHVPEELNDSQKISKIPVSAVEAKKEVDVLVTQADFAVVDSGTLVLLDKNCKNCLQSVKKIFIVLDISKLVCKLSDLESIIYVRSLCAHGELAMPDIKFINQPFKRISQSKGQHALQQFDAEPVEISIFMYDNGMTNLLHNPALQPALYCIDCGQCKSVCPVFSVNNVITPIDLVRQHCQDNEHTGTTLSGETTLCGNCDQVCPVRIPITSLLHAEMEQVNHTKTSLVSKAFLKRKKFNKMQKGLKRYFFLNRTYGKNKMLFNYFRNQDAVCYNAKWREENEENDK